MGFYVVLVNNLETTSMYINIYRGSEIFKTEIFGAFSEKKSSHIVVLQHCSTEIITSLLIIIICLNSAIFCFQQTTML